MSQINAIFQGVPFAESRKVLAKYLESHKFSTYFIPCVGRFSIAQVMVKCGVKPEQIYCSDITLFSSVLGYYFANRNINDLKIKITDPTIEHLFSRSLRDEDQVAATLFAIKYGQIKDEAYYWQALKRELLYNAEKYIGELKTQIQAHKNILNGINYNIHDARQDLQYVKDAGKEDWFVYFNPPGFKSGYEKMFDVSETITWEAPHIEQISPEEFTSLVEPLTNNKAIVMINTSIKELPRGWVKLFAKERNNDSTNHLIINRSEDIRHISKRKGEPKKAPYPLYDDHEITKNSKVKVISIGKDTAYYYRDLFIHRLGSASADLTFGILIDGQLMSVVGLSTQYLFGIHVGSADKFMKNYINETYGMTVPSKKYKRLRRLFMMLISCKQFANDVERLVNIGVADLTAIRTACLTRLPENRIIHGLFKLISKEQMKNGNYKLIYETPFHDRTYRDCIIVWLDELRREEERNKKK